MTLADARACAVVMARRPGAAAAKTRLAARLDEAERGALYEAFLRDKLAALARVPELACVVAVAPPDDPSSLAPFAPAGATFIAQRGDDLGARLTAVSEDLFARGARAVLLCDSDSPTLPSHFIDEAARALASGDVDVVLGPAADGGYTLLGTSRPIPELFVGIPWSTSAVLRETLAAADRARLRVHLLPSWFDVDVPEDLDRLVRELACASPYADGYATATASVLAHLVTKARERPRDEHWKTRSLRGAYQNRWMNVTERVVTLPSGHVTLYGVVETAACVGVLPVLPNGDVLLVRQFRYVARRFTWEMPTGGVHAHESLAEAAHRELREEAGVVAKTMTRLVGFDTSKSVVDEHAHLFVAEIDPSASAAGAEPDPTEEIERRAFSRAEARHMIDAGEITDSMTVIALLMTTPG